jgi:hypothetical protein
MRIASGLFVLAALVVAGCGSKAAEPTKLTGLQEYPSAQALADDLTKHGHKCDMEQLRGGMNSTDSGRCYVNGKEMILAIYTSQSQIDKQLAFDEDFYRMGKFTEYGTLVGKNWTINCGSRAACTELQKDLGGSITAPLG